MCGRYAFLATPDELVEWFGLPAAPPRYNVAPSQPVPVVGLKPDGSGRRGLAVMRWGFVPRWAKSPADGPRPINARAETVATSPAFRDSFRLRRCLIPMSGFYEWDRRGGGKRPYLFRPAAGPAAFAGVWDVWAGAGGPPLYTFAVVTVPANDVVRPCHDRMPAVLTAGRFAAWLDPAARPADLLALLRPLPADGLEVVAVGPAVNSPKNDGPECLTPAA